MSALPPLANTQAAVNRVSHCAAGVFEDFLVSALLKKRAGVHNGVHKSTVRKESPVNTKETKGCTPARRQLVGLQSARESGMAKLIKARKKSASAKQNYIEPITCPHCGGQAHLMRRTPHPKIKGEVWTFECKDCGKQTEKSKLNN